jgi:hypothetical protein
MDKKHIDFWSSDDASRSLILRVQSGFFEAQYFAAGDPSRIKAPVADNIKMIQELFYLASRTWSRVLKDPIDLEEADIKQGLSGGIKHGDEVSMIIFTRLPVRPVLGSEWTFYIPLTGSLNQILRRRKPPPAQDNIVPIILPLTGTDKFIITDNMAQSDSPAGIILLPGTIVFTKLVLGGMELTVGRYKSLSAEQIVANLGNPDIVDIPPQLKEITPAAVAEYLVAYHSRRVQESFYSAASYMDKKFYLASSKDPSYYESNNWDPAALTPLQRVAFPLVIPLYMPGKYKVDGPIIRPIPMNVVCNYCVDMIEPMMVDARVIDLNFMWIVQNRTSSSKDTYFLSVNDAVELKYGIHSPGVVMAVKGRIFGSEIRMD